jgi:uncharacterized protein (DUF885 family)
MAFGVQLLHHRHHFDSRGVPGPLRAVSEAERLAGHRIEKMFGSYAFIEGWAHYTEQMMLEEASAAARIR